MTSAQKFPRGLVIGKFLPPHLGHSHLINAALAQSKSVTVIVCVRPTDPIPGDLRVQWLQELHPAATVFAIDDRYDENDSRIWAENTIKWMNGPPDAVFTSENYGDAYARHLGCTHISVDPARNSVPCSGTAVRDDPFAQWDFIAPPVRAWYAKRIVILGAESTGTTTLARDLAQAFQTNWVEEYGREYSALKQEKGETTWTSDEFLTIAREQTRRENLAARECNRLLICDTNVFATTLWHQRYLGSRCPELENFARSVKADLYLLTGDEIPFIQDGLRDGEHLRHDMHRWFIDALQQQLTPWQLVSGPPQTRLEQAQTAIHSVFSSLHK
ncbi:MAG: AAA family ATPase [Verrucomicrobiales bacterium]